ncbi:hypothetical protein [Streptomyces spiramyceticus]|uniref:hypothetical protein n=1 Tax=Streptomyces spiramyceticus TaxID=299717 RepID=UPI00237C3860|nr:hypothetical protein [Streptomyces spiramyceticus]
MSDDPTIGFLKADVGRFFDHIHTMAVYSLALQLAVFSRKGVQRSLDQAAQMNEAIGGRPRPYSVA